MHHVNKTKLFLDEFVDYYDYDSDFLRLTHGLKNAGYVSTDFVYTALDAAKFHMFKDEPHYTNEVDPVSQKPFIFGISGEDIKSGMEQGVLQDDTRANLADYCDGYERPAIVVWDAKHLELSTASDDQFYFSDFEKRHAAVSHFLEIYLPDGS